MEREVFYSKPGDVRSFERVTEFLVDPSDKEVQVRVRAIGINFADVFGAVGLYAAAGRGRFIPGLEYAGVVVQIGKGVTSFNVGDRVMGVTRFGAYSTGLNVDHRLIVPLPSAWTFEQGAGYLVAVLTAYYGLVELCRVRKEETVLIHSAAGGVGVMANRIAKKFECFTIGLVGSEEKVEFCRKEGYDRVIVRSRDFREELQKALDGRELNVVMECTGGRFHRESLRALAKRGRMAVYGFAYYMPKGNRISYLSTLWKYVTRPRIDLLHLNNISISTFNLIYLFDAIDDIRAMFQEIEKLDAGLPTIGSTYTFEQLPEAVIALKSGKTTGKIVVTLQG